MHLLSASHRAHRLSAHLIKSTAVVGAMTLLSRVLGFVRDIVIARYFGAGTGTDAFFVAFKIPNFMRRLFAEGAFSQAFVPVLSEYKEKGSREVLKDLIDRTAGTLAAVLFGVTLVGVLAAPVLITIFAPGFDWEGDRYELSVQMLRLTFPYLMFISLTAMAGGVLNTFGKFAIPAITPIFLNLSFLAAIFWLAPLLDEPVMALAWGVLLAGVVQLAFQFPSLRKLGLMPSFKPDFKHSGVRRILKLMVPALFGVSVTQINLLVDTLLASFLVTGSVSWLYYSDRLVEFPLGVFGIALATVLLPNLSKSHAQEQGNGFSHTLDWGLRWVLLIGLPAAGGLFFLALPILMTLFQYQAFTPEDAIKASYSLMAYAVGLLAFIGVKVLVPGYTARQDMKTPVRIGVIAMVSNMVMSVALVFPLQHAGLALATSLAAFINAGLLLRGLLREGIYTPAPGLAGFTVKILLANVLAACVYFFQADYSRWVEAGMLVRAGMLAVDIASVAGVYVVALVLLGIRPRHLMLQTKP